MVFFNQKPCRVCGERLTTKGICSVCRKGKDIKGRRKKRR